MIGDYTDLEMQDIILRDRARDMAEALRKYGSYRDHARFCERQGDTRSAAGFRADARAALHHYPQLLAEVEK
jgi:hypothetical protein